MNLSNLLKAGLMQRSICVILAISMAVSPSMNVLAQDAASRPTESGNQSVAPSAPQPRAAGEATAMIDTTYVPSTAFALVVLRPAQLMKSPAGQVLPVEVATAAGLKYLGIDPGNIEEVGAFMVPSVPPALSYGLILKFANPVAGFKIPPELRAHTQPGELAGKKYLKSQQLALPSFYTPNDRTLVVAPDATLRPLVERPAASKTGPIMDRVRNVRGGSDVYAAVDLATLRPLIQMGLSQAQSEIPPEARKYLDAVNHLAGVELTLNLSKAGVSSLVVHANDEAAARKVESLMVEAEEQFRQQMRAQMTAELAKQRASEDPVERAWAQYADRVSAKSAVPFMPKREGADFTLFRIDGANSPQQPLVTIAVIGVLVALLLPAVRAAREAARRNVSMNNMRQMSIALQNYHDTRKSFPAHAIYSKDGKPLLSWRVAILPFLEEPQLYSQFHLDEPWDSEHNRPLMAQMPEVFKNPSHNLPPGKTNYLAAVGKECVMDGTKDGKPIQAITDGTSKTIVLVEANADQAVDWTKPDDWKFDSKNPKAGLGKAHPGGWLAAFADAHIEFISDSFDAEMLKMLFTRAGREVIPNY